MFSHSNTMLLSQEVLKYLRERTERLARYSKGKDKEPKGGDTRVEDANTRVEEKEPQRTDSTQTTRETPSERESRAEEAESRQDQHAVLSGNEAERNQSTKPQADTSASASPRDVRIPRSD
jgi:hypothetical protein